uniref:Uncharacterized protein n=1 Tax=Rhizophora mucronata TaxID=61149 RepID=A0A2P2R2L1_RHIMU
MLVGQLNDYHPKCLKGSGCFQSR